jgi:hypothetical protein
VKLLKFGLRFWITLTSVVSFIGGWIMLAHAPKPNQQNSAYSNITAPASAPTLEPLPPLSDFNASGNDNQSQPWSIFQQQPNLGFRQTFRTGGS